MKITVIIPVGPDHQELSLHAVESVYRAWDFARGPFTNMEIIRVSGHPRSKARNLGMDSEPADWHFLLDADDTMMVNAFSLAKLDYPATFGAICLNGRVSGRNRWPVDREKLFRYGADGTLCMGFFLDASPGLRFDESLDNGEDFDFYARLPGFIKLTDPLVNIRYRGGKQAAGAGWHEACRHALNKYRP